MDALHRATCIFCMHLSQWSSWFRKMKETVLHQPSKDNMDNLQILSPELHIFSVDTFSQWSPWFLKTKESVFCQQPKDETDSPQVLSLGLCIFSADTLPVEHLVSEDESVYVSPSV